MVNKTTITIVRLSSLDMSSKAKANKEKGGTVFERGLPSEVGGKMGEVCPSHSFERKFNNF